MTPLLFVIGSLSLGAMRSFLLSDLLWRTPECQISQIERVCQQLNQGKAEEIRGETKAILKNIRPPRPNISKGEEKAIQELRKDQGKIYWPLIKGCPWLCWKKDDYIRKSEDLLKQNTYRELAPDPTNKYKNKLISLLKTIKSEGGINNSTYRRLYPTGAVSPKYYGLPKIHKPGVPLRPIISSRGSATYETAKELANIIKPLVGRSPHHVQNNKDFLENITDIKLQPYECIMSYDVSALFTSIPIDPAIKTIKKHLEEDQDLSKRTSMTVNHNHKSAGILPKKYIFFIPRQVLWSRQRGLQWLSNKPTGYNLFMEEFEKQAISTSTTPPILWKRFVDDTFTIIKKNNQDSFLEHLNSINPKIQFTCEETREDGSMPFLDVLVTPEDDGSLKTSCFRKQHTLICTSNGTATILFHLSTVWLVPYFIEHLLHAPPPTVARRRRTPLQSCHKM